MNSALWYTAEVDRNVGTAISGALVYIDDEVIVAGRVLKESKFWHDDVLTPDAILVIQGELEGAGFFHQMNLELMIHIGKVNEKNRIGLDRIQSPSPHTF